MPRWEQPAYARMVSIDFKSDLLHVEFADGDVATVDPTHLTPRHLQGRVDWALATIDGPEIQAPAGSRVHAVSWLDVRALVDREFAAYLARVADEEARQVGQKIRYLRESRGLASAELAARADITPQSLSRIELGRHDVVYSTLQRLLASMNYTLRDLAEAPTEALESDVIVRRLKKAGLPSELVARLAPESERTSLVLDRLYRIFGWSGSDIVGSDALPIRASVALAAAFKSTLRQHPELGPYVLYAHYLAGLVRHALPQTDHVPIPTDAMEIRDELLREDHRVIDFESLLEWTWNHGIAVMPLFDPGQFHGACWLFDGQPVIVLKQRTESDARFAFDLAHELGHIALHLTRDHPAMVETAEISFANDDESEEEASEFAGALLLGDGEKLVAQIVKMANQRVEFLANAVKRLAPRARVSVGALANYLAWRLEGEADWWGAAANLQQSAKRPEEVAVRLLLSRLELDRLADDDRALLLNALEASS
jgi:Zn-dependent peptidase ImmA (M78 family)/transcriptional regulator with XRE-family HTH domain